MAVLPDATSRRDPRMPASVPESSADVAYGENGGENRRRHTGERGSRRALLLFEAGGEALSPPRSW